MLQHILSQVRHEHGERITSINSTLERMGIYSLLVNVGLVALKLGLAALSGSLALAASATDSAVDIFASLGVLIGLFMAKRKAKVFPFGLSFSRAARRASEGCTSRRPAADSESCVNAVTYVREN